LISGEGRSHSRAPEITAQRVVKVPSVVSPDSVPVKAQPENNKLLSRPVKLFGSFPKLHAPSK
jgi:hypothetical protein